MLNKDLLKTNIQNAMLSNITNPTDQQKNEIAAFAGSMADAIDSYVRGVEISYTAGLTSPSGAVTGLFNYTLN